MSAPRYTVIVVDLKRRIALEEFPDKKLPSMRAIVKEYRTSLRTVCRVFEVLTNQGYITVKPGIGAYYTGKSLIPAQRTHEEV
jgi:DNA-binding transcriptional regulator YhcF (GntR family)